MSYHAHLILGVKKMEENYAMYLLRYLTYDQNHGLGIILIIMFNQNIIISFCIIIIDFFQCSESNS